MPVPPSSVYADEGSAAHALAELYARHYILKKLSGKEFHAAVTAWRQEWFNVIFDESEMIEHAETYVRLLIEKLAEHPDSQLMLEQRVPTGIPSCWGTSDAVIVSPVHVEIVDLKYGKGIQVEADDNPQLKLYGVGALEAFGDLLGDPEQVKWTVFQPRLDHTVSDELSAPALREWRDSLIPIAEEALGEDAHFGPSDEACRWCPASGNCKAQLTWVTQRDFGIEPETLSEEELSEALAQVPAIQAWCASIMDYALDHIYSQGAKVPGYKVVRSGGKRRISDEQGAIEALELLGYDREQVARTSTKTLGDLEKLMGKTKFAKVLDPFITKGDGSLSVVPADDPRDAADPNQGAQAEFGEEESVI